MLTRKKEKIRSVFKACFLFSCVATLLPVSVFGQQKCREVFPDSSFTVHAITIKGRWVPENVKKEVAELIGVGGPFHNSNVSAAVARISDESKRSEMFFPPRLAGAFAVSYTTVDYCAAPDTAKQVEVIIYPRYLRIDLFSIGHNFLPILRSPKPTFYEAVPKSLLALSPVVGFNSDRRYGPSFSLQTTSDLLHLTRLSNVPHPKLNLGLEVQKSLTENFFTLGSELSFSHPVKSTSGMGWEAGGNFLSGRQPLGVGIYEVQRSGFHGLIQQNLQHSFVKGFAFGGALRFLSNKFDTLAGKRAENTENGYSLFLLSDGLLKQNFGRIALWFDQGFPKRNNGSYRRLSAKAGYSTAFKTGGDAHQTLGIELTGGIGHIWGNPPVYSQFYAGNAAANFLYEPTNNLQLRSIPNGPVVRSLGEKEGMLLTGTDHLNGGTAYWHLNLNISIPVPQWSRPLIPPVVIDEATGATLQTKLKSLARGTAESGIATDLIDNKGYPDNEQTDSLAKKMVEKDIMPMIGFVTDRANVFSIKPLLLFDVAGMSGKDLSQKTFVAAGGGVQLTVVIARLGAGYMRTIAPSTGTSKGNFFLQFVFENFY